MKEERLEMLVIMTGLVEANKRKMKSKGKIRGWIYYVGPRKYGMRAVHQS